MVVVVVAVAVAAIKVQMAHVSAGCFKSSLYSHNFSKTRIIVSTVM